MRRSKVVLLTLVVVFSGVLAGQAAPAIAYPVVSHATDLAPADLGEGVLESPFTFTMLGVTYEGEATDFEVRTRAEDGWSDWKELHTDPAEGPDPGSADDRSSRTSSLSAGRLSTLPMWTGAAEAAQIRLAPDSKGRRAAELQVHFLDATGKGLGPVKRLGAQLLSRSTPEPAAAAGQPNIVTRASWGADESLRSCGPDYASGVKGGFVHHTAGSNTYTATDSPAIVRSIYQYHVQTNGWCDIGYNFLVDRFGTLFEGRHGGMDRAVIGAHAGGFNTGSTGVSVLGDFTNVDPSTAAVDAIVRILSWKYTIHGVDPRGQTTYTSGGNSKYPEGTQVTVSTVSGHRDVVATACPTRLYNFLPNIRSRVAIEHPSGTLVKGSGPGVFYVENGRKRGIPSLGVFESRFRWSEVIPVWDTEISSYPDAAILGFRDGSLIRTPDGTVWVISTGQRRGITSGEVFNELGYSWANVRNVTNGEASIHPVGVPLFSSALHPDGSLVKGSGPAVFYLDSGRRRGIPSPGALESRFRWAEVVPASDSEIDAYPVGAPLGFRDGSIIQTPDGTVWVISAGQRRGVSSLDAFTGLGYSWSNIRAASFGEAGIHPVGPNL